MTLNEYRAFIVDCVGRDDPHKLHGLIEQLHRYGFSPIDIFCFVADIARQCLPDEGQRWVLVILYGSTKNLENRFQLLKSRRPTNEYLNEMYDQYLFDEKCLG